MTQRVQSRQAAGGHLKPGQDVKVLLHVCAQHLLNDDRPEGGQVLLTQVLHDPSITP